MYKSRFLFAITFISSAILLQSCSTTDVPTTNVPTTNVPTTDVPTTQAPISLQVVESNSGGGSCINYELQDGNKQKITLPKEVEDGLNCPWTVKLSPTKEYLLYIDNYRLKLYDLKNKKITDLTALDDNIQGVTCDWSPKESKIACIEINQNDFPSLTKIIVVSLKDGQFLAKKEYNETADFTCASDCFAKEFWFEKENTLKYMGHSALENPQQTHTIAL